MPIYKHICSNCRYLGTDTLLDQPADIYFCDAEEPVPTILIRTGNEEHQYSSLDILSILEIAQNPVTDTNKMFVTYLKQVSIDQARRIH